METNQTYQNELGSAMLPFVMRELVDTVMKRKTLPLEDALYYIYSSNLYKALLDENTKLWYSSTLSLYEALEKEKTEQKKVQKDNPKILLFQMFCAENYRETKNISAKETLLLFSNHGVFEFLYENFEMLHTQDTESRKSMRRPNQTLFRFLILSYCLIVLTYNIQNHWVITILHGFFQHFCRAIILFQFMQTIPVFKKKGSPILQFGIQRLIFFFS